MCHILATHNRLVSLLPLQLPLPPPFVNNSRQISPLSAKQPRVYGIADQKGLVLDIDVQGARQLNAKIPEAVTVFILAPSRLVLEQRLRARSEDREDVIARRIREAAEEIRRSEDYDYVLINRELAEAEATLSAIVRAERCPANQNRRPDPAHFGHISSLR
jgi:guanylate kinase